MPWLYTNWRRALPGVRTASYISITESVINPETSCCVPKCRRGDFAFCGPHWAWGRPLCSFGGAKFLWIVDVTYELNFASWLRLHWCFPKFPPSFPHPFLPATLLCLLWHSIFNSSTFHLSLFLPHSKLVMNQSCFSLSLLGLSVFLPLPFSIFLQKHLS